MNGRSNSTGDGFWSRILDSGAAVGWRVIDLVPGMRHGTVKRNVLLAIVYALALMIATGLVLGWL